MRIAFDYQTFALQAYGGIPRYFVQLANSLLKLGESVDVIAPLYQNNYLGSLPKSVVHGRHIRRYPPKTTKLFLKYNQIVSDYKIAQSRPDIVHETYYSAGVSTRKTCPRVITVYDMIHELHQGEFLKSDKTTSNKVRAIADADHVICISENTKKDLTDLFGTPNDKVSVVHLGFENFMVSPGEQLVKALEEKPFLLFVGSRDGYKNFLGLLKAVALSPHLRKDFDIVAFGGGKFTPEEVGAISSLGLGENQVRYMGGDDGTLGDLYSTARALVYPSIYEGFGMPPLEAMAHRCPVVSSNSSSMPEVIGLAAEYFSPSDVGSIQLAIEQVVYSESRIEELILLGINRLEAFSWTKCAGETLNIYQKLQ
jgi:glycosyltransferase involved in cell wall biosynthesis